MNNEVCLIACVFVLVCVRYWGLFAVRVDVKEGGKDGG
jgi:hypothetical protein